jgi:RND family efflux transporter MFP subunit
MRELIRRSLQIGVGGAVLIGAVIWLSGGFGDRIGPDQAVSEPAAVPASTPLDEVEVRVTPLFESASGTIYSAHHTTISSKILARIETIGVRAGDEIAEGALVVRLDSRDLEARLRAAREAVASARAALDLATSERARIAGLFESRVVSQRQLDEAVAGQQMAAAELERAAQGVADAEVGASHAEIRSPVAGRVVDRLAEPGDTAAPGAPLLRIYDPGAMRLEAPVREALAVQLRPGQALEVYVESLGLTLEGQIDEIVPAAEPGARTFLVKVRLPHDPRLFAGMFGRVRLPAGEGPRIQVSRSAIERIGQLEYATVVDSQGVARRRMVTTGVAVDDEDVEVLSGLAAGERVVVQ